MVLENMFPLFSCRILVYNERNYILKLEISFVMSRFDAKINQLRKAIDKLDTLHFKDDFTMKLLEWFIESANKNYHIFRSKQDKGLKDIEASYAKEVGHVYWTEFGMNIGSEYNDFHYSVVIKESVYTCIVVPFTSKKENVPKWFVDDDGIVDIGKINGFPEKQVDNLACVSLIKTVSKKRLSRCGDKQRGYFDLILTPDQMKKINDAIKNNFVTPLDK